MEADRCFWTTSPLKCPDERVFTFSATSDHYGTSEESATKAATDVARRRVVEELVELENHLIANAPPCPDGCRRVIDSSLEDVAVCSRSAWYLWFGFVCTVTASGRLTFECVEKTARKV